MTIKNLVYRRYENGVFLPKGNKSKAIEHFKETRFSEI